MVWFSRMVAAWGVWALSGPVWKSPQSMPTGDVGLSRGRNRSLAQAGTRSRGGPETAADGLHLCWCGFQCRRDGQLGRIHHCLHHTARGMGWDGCMNEFSVRPLMLGAVIDWLLSIYLSHRSDGCWAVEVGHLGDASSPMINMASHCTWRLDGFSCRSLWKSFVRKRCWQPGQTKLIS